MKISVVIVVKNEERFIRSLLGSLLRQSYEEFELIIIDNNSTDKTSSIIKSFSDQRIKYFFESSSCGLARLRNLGISKAKGEYIFFTDGDCAPDKHWIEEGLKVLETGEYVGVSGKTYYESEGEVTVSDCNTHQFVDGQFMSCNVVYRRDILERVNYFDPVFEYSHEDRDLAYRVLKVGKIYFSADMLVAHKKKRLSIEGLLNRAKRTVNEVDFIKRHKKHPRLKGFIFYPRRLLIIFCPIVLIFVVSYRGPYDLIYGFLKYFVYIYERFLIWKAALRNKIFII